MAVIKVQDAQGNEYDMEIEDEHPAAQRIGKKEQERLARENAFLKAGINPSDGRLAYFAAGYQGDLDPAKIKEAAIRDGFVEAPKVEGEPPADPEATAPVDPTVPASHAANTAISAISQGGTPDTRSDIAQMVDAYNEGGQPAVIDFMRARGFTIQADSQR